MSQNGANAEVEQLGLAVVAGLLALMAPLATIALLVVLLAMVVVHRETAQARSTAGGPPLALVLIAVSGIAFGAAGAVAVAIAWLAFAEVARTRETQGMTEPPWMALAYRWAPVAAALLFRLDAPAIMTTVASVAAAIALADWSLRRLAEWRLGEPQPFDTTAYLVSQARVLALVLIFPEPIAALAAFAALGLARAVEAPLPSRYATAL